MPDEEGKKKKCTFASEVKETMKSGMNVVNKVFHWNSEQTENVDKFPQQESDSLVLPLDKSSPVMPPTTDKKPEKETGTPPPPTKKEKPEKSGEKRIPVQVIKFENAARNKKTKEYRIQKRKKSYMRYTRKLNKLHETDADLDVLEAKHKEVLEETNNLELQFHAHCEVIEKMTQDIMKEVEKHNLNKIRDLLELRNRVRDQLDEEIKNEADLTAMIKEMPSHNSSKRDETRSWWNPFGW